MNNIKTSQLGYYLAGLIEGDGNIWTSKRLISVKSQTYNPRIQLTFHANEMPFFRHMKLIFGTGGLYQEKLSNVCRYSISDKNTLIEVINLINGKFRTPKIKYLHKAIDYINLIHGTNIPKLPLDNSNLESNAWLAGFTDADGTFHIGLYGVYGLNNSMAIGRVQCTFSITQRITDKPTGLSCIPFMEKIADLYQSRIYYGYSNDMKFIARSNCKHNITKSYFDKYPLMTSKYLNYLCFLQGLDYLGKRLTDKEIVEIKTLKNSMNKKRTYFNWDHLNNFYKK